MRNIFFYLFNTVKRLNSRYLWVLKSSSVIERCPLSGGNLKKDSRSHLGLNFLSAKTRKIILYRMILITGLWLVRKVNILLWVCKTGKVYLLHAVFLLLFTFFQTQDFLNFYSLNIFIVQKGVSALPFWYPPFL